MKAVICESYGPPNVLKIKEVQKPEPKDNEVLVRIRATAVNSGDVRTRGLAVNGLMKYVMRLVLGIRRPRQPILGTVLAGVVEDVGADVQKLKPGDEVYAMTGFKFGTYAEYITLKETGPITLKPKKASFEEAAAIIFGGSTAIYFLQKAGIGVKPHQSVLIYGASGAVGSAAVQIAKYYNANVTAVCGEDAVELMKKLGADDVVIYTNEDFTKNGEKYDIIFDAVGKKPKKECRESLAADGKYVTTGGMDVASEKKEQLDLLKELFDGGQYDAVIDRVYSMEDIVKAHEYVDQGKKKGNVIIAIGK